MLLTNYSAFILTLNPPILSKYFLRISKIKLKLELNHLKKLFIDLLRFFRLSKLSSQYKLESNVTKANTFLTKYVMYYITYQLDKPCNFKSNDVTDYVTIRNQP